MGRPRNIKTLADYERALHQGFGLGTGCHYKPWLRVQDVPSLGRSSKIFGITTQREHHCLSDGETRFFYLAEFNSSVVDIREQFPLIPLDLISRIAKQANIKYPVTPKHKYPCVLTTDFLLTIQRNSKTEYLAVAIKNLNDLAVVRQSKKYG